MSGVAKSPAPLVAVKPAPTTPKVVTEAYSFRRQGLPHVRKAATGFGIILLLSIALVAGGRFMVIKTRPATQLAQQNQSAALERLLQAETERKEINDFQTRFEQLRARGFFGDENRLGMVEAIRDIQRARNLLPISYEVAPQQVVALDPSLLAAPLELHSSTVTVRMGLLHEMDLVNFLHDLRGRGMYTVKDCLMTAANVGPADPTMARLDAECTLFWLTVGEPAAAPVAPEA